MQKKKELNVKIGEDTIIDKSIIWDNVVIGPGCNINESIICNNCIIPNNQRFYLT